MNSKDSSKQALFSLSNTSCAVEFGKQLQELGWKIIATDETVTLLEKEGTACISIGEYTGIQEDYGIPPTLHPKIEMALTGTSDERIDLVYDIPYGSEVGNDVGGLTLLALAAKGGRIPVMTHEDMQRVLSELKNGSGSVSNQLLQELHDKTHHEIANHYLDLMQSAASGTHEIIVGQHVRKLANGENPYQQPCVFYQTDADDLGLATFELRSKICPCFTNMADFDSILETLTLLTQAFQANFNKVPFISIASKHGNPCGVAVDWKAPHVTIQKALFGSPLAVWGGEFISNFEIDEEAADLLIKSSRRKETFGKEQWLLDISGAPCFSEKALELMQKRESRKILTHPQLQNPHMRSSRWAYRHVRGGFLKQPIADFILSAKNIMWNSEALEGQVYDDMLIAWAVAFTSFHGGNEVALAKRGALQGCAGGPSTVQAVQTTIQRATDVGHDLEDSVFAADAFFPFTDAPELLEKVGCCAGVVPLGSKHDADVKDYFLEHNVRMAYLTADIRGFCRH